jgi:hypothetical protein
VIDNAVHVMRMPPVSLYNPLLLVDGLPRIWRRHFVKNIARTKAAASMLLDTRSGGLPLTWGVGVRGIAVRG